MSAPSAVRPLLSLLAGVRAVRVGAMLAVWRNRWAGRRALRDLSPRLLRDIGVSAAEAEAEARKPFWRG